MCLISVMCITVAFITKSWGPCSISEYWLHVSAHTGPVFQGQKESSMAVTLCLLPPPDQGPLSFTLCLLPSSQQGPCGRLGHSAHSWQSWLGQRVTVFPVKRNAVSSVRTMLTAADWLLVPEAVTTAKGDFQSLKLEMAAFECSLSRLFCFRNYIWALNI